MTENADADGVALRSLVLPDSTLAPRIARQAIAGLLMLCPPVSRDQLDTATLLTSEVVTNALRHACPPRRGSRRFRLTVSVQADLLRVEVYDQDPNPPTAGHAADDDENGRGLTLLATLAKDWGTALTPHQPGKTVWFTLPLG